MKRNHKIILAVVLFTLLFMLLILAGALAWADGSRRTAILCFVLSPVAVGGQIVSLLQLGRKRLPPTDANQRNDSRD